MKKIDCKERIHFVCLTSLSTKINYW